MRKASSTTVYATMSRLDMMMSGHLGVLYCHGKAIRTLTEADRAAIRAERERRRRTAPYKSGKSARPA